MKQCVICNKKIRERATFCSMSCRKEATKVEALKLIGEEFGKWKVESLKEIGKHTIYSCRCVCGTVKNQSKCALEDGRTLGCRACRDKDQVSTDTVPQWFYGTIKKCAASRGIPFDVSRKELEEVYEKQRGKCRYTGWDIRVASSSDKKATTASLDRLHSDQPYIKGNVQWVHKHVNLMKHEHTEEYFLKLCNAVVSHVTPPSN
jgi:hypothetical protein